MPTNAPHRLPVLCLGLIVAVLPLGCGHAATGGPDMFGHTFIDSLDPAGPAFMGVDISMTGMALGGGDDVLLPPVALTRPINLYGSTVSSIRVSTNGFITDTGTSSDRFNSCPIPAPGAGGGARLYVLQDDLIAPNVLIQYFVACPRPADRGTGPIGCTIVQWDNVTHFGSAVPWDMWAYLYDNQDVVYEYGPGNPETGSGSTTGLQDATATDALSVACNMVGSIPNNYAVLIEFPCDQATGLAGAGLAPPTTSLTVSGMTVVDAGAGAINGVPDVSYRGGGIFYFTSIDIQAGGTLTFAGATAPDFRATGDITVNGVVDLDGTIGLNSNNGQPGGALIPGVAGGGHGGAGGCASTWQSRLAQRGGGSTGGFGGSHPPGSSGFADVTGGGGGGNGTAGADGDPPIGAFTTEPGRGGCANLSPLVSPLRGGGGGGGGGCDVDDAAGPRSTGTANDGGASGGSGGGAIRLQAAGNVTIGATGNISADGGDGGDNGGNGGAAGGGAGGTILLIAGGDVTFNGTISAVGGARGLLMQVGAGANGGDGGDGIVGMYDSDGVIAGAGVATPAPITGTTPVFGSGDLVIDNLDLPNASPTQPYSATISASGGSGSYTFSVFSGALPGGLMLDSMTGAITGTSSTTPGVRSEFAIRVSDGMDTYDRAFCILTQDTSLAITTDSLPPVDPMMPYMSSIVIVGGTGTPVYTIGDGALPTGLTLDSMTGVISGMTGANPEAATFTVNVSSALDLTDSQTYSILVGQPAGSLPILDPVANAEECFPYGAMLSSAVGTPPHTFELISGTLPPMLTYDPLTATISGTPDVGTAGVYDLCFYVYDSAGLIGPVDLAFTVDPPSTPPSCIVAIDSMAGTSCAMPGVAIPDNDPLGVTSTINIPASGVIQSMTVDLAITHTWVGDLHVELTHVPSLTTVVLTDRPGDPAVLDGCQEDDVNCTFSDAASTPVEGVCSTIPPAIGGLVIPDQALAAFAGLDMSGDWQLLVTDNVAFDTGTLDMWCLDIDFTPIPQGGNISVEIEPIGTCDPTVEVVSVEYSLDGGATFLGPCTPAATSPIMPPQLGVPVGSVSIFLWNSPADGVATMGIENQVVVRTTIMGSTGMSTCETIAFQVDNQCLCGDCDMSGMLPVTVLDALIAAQISAGLVVPTSLQARCCDVNGVGGVTIVDALVMAQSAAGLAVPLMCP